MKFTKAKIPGLIICEPLKIYDERGFFTESFRKDLFENFIGHSVNFCQENISESNFGVLRGLHFQTEPFAQAKLISVSNGKILDIAVDLRKNSKFYGKSFSIELDNFKNKQIFIPRGFAHGFIVLSKKAKIIYKVDNYYNPKAERGLNYDDPALKINWKLDKKFILQNEKDKNYPPFKSNSF